MTDLGDKIPQYGVRPIKVREPAVRRLTDEELLAGTRRTNDIENRFSFHPADTDERRNAHEQIRNSFKTVAHYVAGIVPPGREQSLMLTALEEAMFWANAGIARQQ